MGSVNFQWFEELYRMFIRNLLNNHIFIFLDYITNKKMNLIVAQQCRVGIKMVK